MCSTNSSGPPQGATEKIHVDPTIDQPEIPAAGGAWVWLTPINEKVRLVLSGSPLGG